MAAWCGVQRAAALLADNRRYRRMALQLQLVGPGPEPLQPMSTDTLGPLPQVAVVPGPPHKLLPDTTAAALDTPAGQQPAPSVPALASAAESSTPAGPPAASSAPTPAAADGTTPAAQLVQLQQELGTARAQLAVLGEENEALLELSNSLRAALERQRGPPGAGLAWGAQVRCCMRLSAGSGRSVSGPCFSAERLLPRCCMHATCLHVMLICCGPMEG
jgi:hypothetical protein